MQDAEEEGTFQFKAVLTLGRLFRDHPAAARFLPKPFKHERWTHAPSCDLRCLLVLCRRQNHGLGDEPCSRLQQSLQLTAGLQFLVASQARPAEVLRRKYIDRLRGAHRVSDSPYKSS